MFSTIKHCFRPYFSFALVLFGASALSVSHLAAQYDFEWIAEGDGDWTTAANWDPDTAFPDEAELFVRLLGNLPAEELTATITLDQEVTIGRLFTRANTAESIFIVSGTGGLVFDNGDDPSTIGFDQGSTGDEHDIQVPLTIVSDTLTLSGRQGIISGNISAASGNDLTVNWTGNGAVILSGTNDFNEGTLNLSGGGLRLRTAGAAGGSDTLIQIQTGGGLEYDLSGGSDINYQNDIVVVGNGSIGSQGGNSSNGQVGTFGSITIQDGATLTVTKHGGGAVVAPLRVGNNGALTLESSGVVRLSNHADRPAVLQIADGSLFQGTGIVYGANRVGTGTSTDDRVVMMSGATLRPGHELSTGVLRVGGVVNDVQEYGTLEVLAGSTMSFRLNGTTPGAGYDQLHVAGVFDMADDAVALDLELGFLYSAGDQLFLLRYDHITGVDVPIGAIFEDLPDGSFINLSGDGGFSGTAQISYFGDFDTNSISGGNDVVLYNFAVIPEPAAVATILGTLALLGAVLWRRRARVDG